MSEEQLAVPAPSAPAKRRRIWLWLVGVLLVGAYAAMFIPALNGQTQNPNNGISSLFWNGLFFYLLWKHRGKKGWHGTLLGMFIGLMAFVAAAFVGGMLRHA